MEAQFRQGSLFCAKWPLSPVTGPSLVYKRAKNGAASFLCSRCDMDFVTTDVLIAFQDFAQHQHQCASAPKPRKTLAVSYRDSRENTPGYGPGS